MNLHGLHRVDASEAARIDDAFMETVSQVLDESGDTGRHLTIKISLGICKLLELKGSRGDAALLANKMKISHKFATKIIHAFKTGEEAQLLQRRRKANAFQETEWPTQFQSFVFRPENARPVPGNTYLLLLLL